MSRKAKSARGEEVDFDLLQVKSNIQKTDKPLDVKTREDFVHLKRRRRGNSKVSQMLAAKADELQKKKDVELANLREDVTVHSKAEPTKEESPKTDETPKSSNKRRIVKKESKEDIVDE